MYNYFMNLQAREQIKVLLVQKGLSLTELAKILTEKTDKKYTLSSLSQKLSRGTVTYNEMLVILNVLGCKIELKELG